MSTPSSSACGSRSCFLPCGQMTETSYPASRSAWHSCQTRRSNGTERFSTRISALPSDTVVLVLALERGRVGQPHEIDDHPAMAVDCLERAADLVVLGGHDARLGV